MVLREDDRLSNPFPVLPAPATARHLIVCWISRSPDLWPWWSGSRPLASRPRRTTGRV